VPAVDVGEAPLAMTFVVHERQAIKGGLVNEVGAPDTMGADVRARRVGDDDEEGGDRSASSNDEGRFAVLGVDAGTYEVSAWAHGERISVGPAVVTVKKGEPVSEVQLLVRTRHRISGQVVDERGLPIAGAGIEASRSPASFAPEPPPELEGWSTAAGDDGRFEIEGLTAGNLRFSVELGGAPMPIVGAEEAAVPGDETITLVARLPAGRIEGRILGAGPAWRGASMQLSGDAGGIVLSQTLPIDEDGRFSALVPPDAEVSLEAVNDEGETAVAEKVKAGDRVELPVRAAATLRGKVHGATGPFRVALRFDERSETFVGTDGSFEMHGVPALSMRVVVFGERVMAAEEITLAPGETHSLDLTLAPEQEELDTMPEGDEPEGEETPGDEAIGEVTEEAVGDGGAD
jgi:hypothetical protein